MIAGRTVSAFTGALVHQSVAAQPVEQARHETFIAHKLAISFAALAVAPFFLAFHGAPTPLESLIFALALAPLGAAVVVARTGRLVVGHAMLCATFLAFALTCCVEPSLGPAASFGWIILARWEAGVSGDDRLARIGGIAAWVALVVVVTGAGLFGDLAGPAAAIGAVAVVYALTTAPFRHIAETATEFADQERPDGLLPFLTALGDVVVALDAGGSVTSLDGHCDALVGLPAADLLGRGLFQIVHVRDRPAFLKLIADAAAGEATSALTIRLRGKAETGMSGAFEPRFVPVEVRAHAGRAPASTMAVLRDASATYLAEQTRTGAQQSLETAVRSKDDFLANMSHELRTPLNAIIGFSEMLASHTLRPAAVDKQREYASIIHQSGQHLLSVVNSILDMSKIQSGTFSILAEPFDLPPLIDQCCDIVRLKAKEGRIRLVRDCPERLDQIVGDKRACKQILINLLSNAVKFTPENGEVSVSVRPAGTAILITVGDTGIGIGAEDLSHLGDPFFQARGSFSRPFEGTGLGLSVVRGLVGLHGGAMTIESEPGKGTNVTIRLPLNCQATPDSTRTATIETIPRRRATETAYPHLSEPRMKSSA